MNINDSVKKATLPPVAQPLVQPNTTAPQRASTATKVNTTGFETEDSVQLSTQYQSTVADTDSFNSEKVEQIKAAIANGQYQINPEKIASGLLNTVQDLLGTQK